MVWTTLLHGQCGEGSLYVDTRGKVTCSVCGEDDVPTMREITAAVQPDEILQVCPNGLLQAAARYALQEVTPHAWHAAASAAREGLRHADALSALPVLEEMETMRHAGEVVCVISADGASGYIVVRESNGARDLRQVFSAVPGRGDLLVSDAVRRAGADTLDCFDGYLPTLYARHGFRETRRETNWTPGGPDVVYMARVPATVR